MKLLKFKFTDLSEPALDIAEAGMGLAPLGLAWLLGGVRGQIEPGQTHSSPEKWPPLNLSISKCSKNSKNGMDGPSSLQYAWKTPASDPQSSHSRISPPLTGAVPQDSPFVLHHLLHKESCFFQDCIKVFLMQWRKAFNLKPKALLILRLMLCRGDMGQMSGHQAMLCLLLLCCDHDCLVT